MTQLEQLQTAYRVSLAILNQQSQQRKVIDIQFLKTQKQAKETLNKHR